MPSHKIEKISADMVRVISEIIFEEAHDEILKGVTITSAKVARDLSYAKIYFTSLKDINKNLLVKEVNNSAPFIRSEVAIRLNLRHTPIIEFVYDESIEYANRIENIIKDLKESD